MKLCDRCRVKGCSLDYLGAACAKARKSECPDVQPNRAEILTNLSIDGLAQELNRMVKDLCVNGVPSPERIRLWLGTLVEEEC